MHYGRMISALVLVLSQISFVAYCGAQASDAKIVEAANKAGVEIEAYVTLRTDTAHN